MGKEQDVQDALNDQMREDNNWALDTTHRNGDHPAKKK